MTTPSTPPGWFPDPDGSGGQRYWDGSAWTDQRVEAPPTTPPEPVAEPADIDQPTAVVSLPPAHDADSGKTEPVSQRPQDEPTLEPPGAPPPIEIPPMPSFDAPSSFDAPTSVTPTSFDAPTTVTPSTYEAPAYQAPAHDTPAYNAPPPAFGGPPPPPPSTPYFGASPTPGGPSDDGRKKLITWYSAACAALLAVLVLAAIYGVFINDSGETMAVGSGEDATTTGETTAAATTTADETASAEPTDTATESPSTPVDGGEATDGPLSFTIHGMELGPTVVSSSAPVEKNAQGQYAVVHLTVTNTSDQPTTFIATFQKLKADGTVYNIDDEATFYLDSGLAELPPGESADVSVAFDIPPGAVPQAIELHADPMSAGTEVPLP